MNKKHILYIILAVLAIGVISLSGLPPSDVNGQSIRVCENNPDAAGCSGNPENCANNGGEWIDGTCHSTASPEHSSNNDLRCGILPQSLCNSATQGDQDNIEDTGVWRLLRLIIVILTAGAGIVAIGGIIYGAVMYTTAGGNQEQVKKARGIITNVVIGIIAFAAMFALLEWLLPGGAF